MNESVENIGRKPERKEPTFSLEEKKFLNTKLQEMYDGALIEDDFQIRQSKNNESYGLYPQSLIENDKKEVEEIKNFFIQRREELYKKEPEKKDMLEDRRITAQYLEALFYEKMGGKEGWIPNSFVYKTAEHDDIKNGIDFVIELDQDHFGVAIDVTLTSQPKEIISKLKAIQMLIDRGQFQEVKYYERPADGKAGSVPVAIIALDFKHAVQALKFWADGEDELLAKHPTRVKAWLETEAQFEAFSVYASFLGQKDITESYQTSLELIRKIITENSSDVEKYRGLIEKDEAYQTILSYCENLKLETERSR